MRDFGDGATMTGASGTSSCTEGTGAESNELPPVMPCDALPTSPLPGVARCNGVSGDCPRDARRRSGVGRESSAPAALLLELSTCLAAASMVVEAGGGRERETTPTRRCRQAGVGDTL